MKKTTLTLLFATLPFAAHAQDKFYVEAGYTALKVDLGIATGNFNGINITTDEEDNVASFFVGYNVNDNFAVEGGMITSANASAAMSGNFNGDFIGQNLVVNGTLKVDADTNESFLVGGKFKLPLNKQFSLEARAGLMWWDVDYTVSANAAGTYGGNSFAVNQSFIADSEDGSDPYYGIGAAYNINDSFSIKANYFRTEIDDGDVDGYSISAAMNF